MTRQTLGVAFVRQNILKFLCHAKSCTHKKEADKRNHEVTQQVAGLLEQALGNWQFDVMDLANATANRPLSTIVVYLFGQLGFIGTFDLDREKVVRFFMEIERGYPAANGYHNRAHGASAVHAMFTLLVHGGLQDAAALALGPEGGLYSVRLGIMACLFAAAIHDFEHEGITNDFMVKTQHPRAARHENLHVNERHHVEAAFRVFLKPANNFLAHLPASDVSRFFDLVRDLVLATDMAENKNILESFVSRLEATPASGRGAGADAPASTGSFEPKTVEDARLVLRVALKCADLGHLTLGWETHVRWVRGLEAEFFEQGDLEKEAGLPVSFLMDRSKPGVSASQVGFLDHVALPLFRALARAAPATGPALAGVARNALRWRELAATEESV